MCAQCCVGKARSPGKMAMHAQTAPSRSKRFADELERLWNKRPVALNRRLTRRYPGEFMKVMESAIDSFAPKFTNATRMLRKQLSAEDVRVWVSAGCLAEFAKIASVAAARTRQRDESYRSCLRREIATRSRFIREWTRSDEKFDQTQWGELVSVAQKYALPRPWRLSVGVASVRAPSVCAPIPAQAGSSRVSDGDASRVVGEARRRGAEAQGASS
jgi:hypothetical protein